MAEGEQERKGSVAAQAEFCGERAGDWQDVMEG